MSTGVRKHHLNFVTSDGLSITEKEKFEGGGTSLLSYPDELSLIKRLTTFKSGWVNKQNIVCPQLQMNEQYEAKITSNVSIGILLIMSS